MILHEWNCQSWCVLATENIVVMTAAGEKKNVQYLTTLEAACHWKSCPMLSECHAWGGTCSPSEIIHRSHHFHWVEEAPQDRPGLFYQPVKSLPVSGRDAAAAPADHTIEDGCCHHRDQQGGGGWPLNWAYSDRVCSGQLSRTFSFCLGTEGSLSPR